MVDSLNDVVILSVAKNLLFFSPGEKADSFAFAQDKPSAPGQPGPSE